MLVRLELNAGCVWQDAGAVMRSALKQGAILSFYRAARCSVNYIPLSNNILLKNIFHQNVVPALNQVFY
jgi:hypothetical protein